MRKTHHCTVGQFDEKEMLALHVGWLRVLEKGGLMPDLIEVDWDWRLEDKDTLWHGGL